ncbi:hypothetical protein P153DRAFT_110606 [Dothidotthia symphoricarpi CBS 119687]|uniref:Secreted protein n=1 Tax=Dothidotthia symphoricarpi CBS 119687 TaxID=1392245 RepID=A0A6A6A3C4_9PLEO|nr:uncharacterized protein P153DRAFT_110606 [Dothidotthia symphoricarpi CBS 119687]KAF2125258.1 hypothetical protein P153DRAFT_110606 [Dothidotthia symphoricarpi CBS 119687]
MTASCSNPAFLFCSLLLLSDSPTTNLVMLCLPHQVNRRSRRNAIEHCARCTPSRPSIGATVTCALLRYIANSGALLGCRDSIVAACGRGVSGDQRTVVQQHTRARLDASSKAMSRFSHITRVSGSFESSNSYRLVVPTSSHPISRGSVTT